MKNFVLAIDLGGTNLRICVVDKQGNIFSLKKIRTPKNEKLIVNEIKELAFEILNEVKISLKNIKGVGVAIASPNVNPSGKVNWNKATFPLKKSFNIKTSLNKYFKKNIFVENDLNAAALAEVFWGKLKGKKNGAIITASTGVGAGIIIDGKIYRGSTFSAGEIGHTIVNSHSKFTCTRNDKGCLESLCSGRSAEQRYYDKYKKRIEAKEIVIMAKKGNTRCMKIINDISYWLGAGITNLINTYDPEAIVIYGSFFLSIWPMTKNNIKDVIKKHSFNPDIKIYPTSLGDNGSILGSASLVYQEL